MQSNEKMARVSQQRRNSIAHCRGAPWRLVKRHAVLDRGAPERPSQVRLDPATLRWDMASLNVNRRRMAYCIMD